VQHKCGELKEWNRAWYPRSPRSHFDGGGGRRKPAARRLANMAALALRMRRMPSLKSTAVVVDALIVPSWGGWFHDDWRLHGL
jgi:hypothetical protein